MAGEGGLRLDGQLIPTQVVGFEGDRPLQIGQSILGALLGQAVHQIQVEVVETAGAGLGDRPLGLIPPVDAAQAGQHGGGEGLGADGQAVDPGLPVGCEGAVLHRPRIGLQGDFGVLRQPRPHPVQQGADGGGGKQARRAAAQKGGGEAQIPALAAKSPLSASM